jgi:hypothetical protein
MKDLTAKEKAKELVEQFKNLYGHPTEQYLDTDEAKQCALIAVNEIYQANLKIHVAKRNIYWDEVKKEIEQL